MLRSYVVSGGIAIGDTISRPVVTGSPLTRGRAEVASACRAVLRRDQQQAVCLRPGAEGLAGVVRLLARRGGFDPIEQDLRVAIGMLAGMAPHDSCRRLERADRLIGMHDEMDRGMNCMLRHARPTAREGESSPAGEFYSRVAQSGRLGTRPPLARGERAEVASSVIGTLVRTNEIVGNAGGFS